MKKNLILLLLTTFSCPACAGPAREQLGGWDSGLRPPGAAPARAGMDTFSDFVRGSARPFPRLYPEQGIVTYSNSALENFTQVIGSARLVGLGEVAHGLHDIQQLRTQLFQYLVQEHKFRAITVESGLIEGLLVERFIQGDGSVSLNTALSRGFTHGMGAFEEMRDLLLWMKDYNAAQSGESAKVHFTGFDLSVLGDTLSVPLKPLAGYLEKVDPEYARGDFKNTLALAERASSLTRKVEAAYLAAGASIIEPDYLDGYTTISFEQLTKAEQAALENGTGALLANLKAKERTYISMSSENEYRDNYRLAEVARLSMNDLRARQVHAPIAFFDKCLSTLEAAGLLSSLTVDYSHLLNLQDPAQVKEYQLGRNSREIASAENIQWTERAYGKTLVYSHNGHLVKTAGTGGDDNGSVSFGVLLNDRYGKDYVLIVSDVDHYTDRTGKPLTEFAGAAVTATRDCNNCLEKEIVKLEEPFSGFLLDIRGARGGAAAYLAENRELRFQNFFVPYVLASAFDGLFYQTSMTEGFHLNLKVAP